MPRWLLEGSATDGYLLEDGSGVVLREEAADAAGVAWLGQISKAPRRSAIPLAASAFIGLVEVVVPAPAVATTLSSPSFARPFYYQSRTQVLAPAAPVVAEVNLGWLQPFSAALQRADAPRLQAATLVVPPFETPKGWFQAFSGAPTPLPPALGSTFVPLNTAQAVVAVTSQVGFSVSAATAVRSFYYQSRTVVLPPTAAPAATPPFWIAPLNVAPRIRGAPQQTTSFIGLVEVQTATPTVAFSVSSPTFARPFYYQSRTVVLPPIAAPVVEANYGWWQPLSQAVPVPQAAQGANVVPFNPAVAPSTGWQQPASRAPPSAPLIQPELRPFAVQQVAAAPEGWQRPLSVAVPRPPVWQGYAFVPFNTAQAAPAATPPFWLTQQNFAPRQRGVPQQTTAFIGLVEVEVPVTTPTVAFNVSSPVFARPFYYQSRTVVLPPVEAPAAVPSQVSFSVSAATAVRSFYYQSRAYALPPVVAEVVEVDYGWHQPLSRAVPAPPTRQGASFVPFDTRQFNTGTVATWVQALSQARPIPRPAAQGASFVPFNTFQPTYIPAAGWYQPLARSVPIPRAALGNAFVPLNTRQENTGTVATWLRPLSQARPIPRAAPQGSAAVPFVQVVYVPTAGWYQALGKAARIPRAALGSTFVPLNTFQPNTVRIDKWQQPLSRPVAIPYVTYSYGYAFVPFDTEQAPLFPPRTVRTNRDPHVPVGNRSNEPVTGRENVSAARRENKPVGGRSNKSTARRGGPPGSKRTN